MIKEAENGLMHQIYYTSLNLHIYKNLHFLWLGNLDNIITEIFQVKLSFIKNISSMYLSRSFENSLESRKTRFIELLYTNIFCI
jgi:hypothetical protein